MFQSHLGSKINQMTKSLVWSLMGVVSATCSTDIKVCILFTKYGLEIILSFMCLFLLMIIISRFDYNINVLIVCSRTIQRCLSSMCSGIVLSNVTTTKSTGNPSINQYKGRSSISDVMLSFSRYRCFKWWRHLYFLLQTVTSHFLFSRYRWFKWWRCHVRSQWR